MTDQHTCEYVETQLTRYVACDEPVTHVAYVNTRNEGWPAERTGPGMNVEIAICEDCIAKLDDDPECYVIETWAVEPA